MNVFVVSDNLEMGGGHTYAVQLVNSLADRGLDVTLAYGRHGENPLLSRVGRGVRMLPLPFRLTHRNKLYHLPNTVGTLAALVGPLRAARAPVVHTLFSGTGLPAWVAAALTQTPVVATPLGISTVAGGLTRRLYRTRWTERLVDRHVVLSAYYETDVVRAFGVLPAKVDVCRLGVDIARFQPLDDGVTERTTRLLGDVPPEAPRFWLGLSARMDPVKHVELAVETVAAVDPSLGVHLAVVGDGPLRADLEALADRLGVRGRVHFLGRHLDVRRLVASFDLYVQTTEGPNLGLAALEALASGVPLLVAARDADEWLMGEDTVLGRGGTVAEATPAALARAVEGYARHTSDERTRVRASARAVAEESYDWEAHVDCVTGVYERLAAGQKKGSDD